MIMLRYCKKCTNIRKKQHCSRMKVTATKESDSTACRSKRCERLSENAAASLLSLALYHFQFFFNVKWQENNYFFIQHQFSYGKLTAVVTTRWLADEKHWPFGRKHYPGHVCFCMLCNQSVWLVSDTTENASWLILLLNSKYTQWVDISWWMNFLCNSPSRLVEHKTRHL